MRVYVGVYVHEYVRVCACVCGRVCACICACRRDGACLLNKKQPLKRVRGQTLSHERDTKGVVVRGFCFVFVFLPFVYVNTVKSSMLSSMRIVTTMS